MQNHKESHFKNWWYNFYIDLESFLRDPWKNPLLIEERLLYTATKIPFIYSFSGKPQSRFPHSCVRERFLYSQDWSTYFLQQKVDSSWEYVKRPQTHEYGNWDCGRAVLFWEYLFRIFGIGSLQCTQKRFFYLFMFPALGFPVDFLKRETAKLQWATAPLFAC